MSVIAAVRKLRHGPLRRWSPVFLLGGRFFRALLLALPFKFATRRMIGPYGPFKLDARFTFTNFDGFVTGKSKGLQRCVEAARGADCVLDVGAHVGFVSLPLSRSVAPGGRVYSFEPSDFNRRLLERNLAVNGITNVEVSGSLVGLDDRAAVPFYQEPGESPLGSTAARFDAQEHNVVDKEQVSLDSFCAARGLRPAVIKIDVEGAEAGVLQGASRILTECRPQLLLSLHRKELIMLGSSIEDVCRLLDGFGYAICDMDGLPARNIGTDEYLCQPKEMVDGKAAAATGT